MKSIKWPYNFKSSGIAGVNLLYVYRLALEPAREFLLYGNNYQYISAFLNIAESRRLRPDELVIV